jgi:hypothetical protein
LEENIKTFVANVPKIFSVSNVSKRWKDELLDYIQNIIW